MVTMSHPTTFVFTLLATLWNPVVKSDKELNEYLYNANKGVYEAVVELHRFMSTNGSELAEACNRLEQMEKSIRKVPLFIHSVNGATSDIDKALLRQPSTFKKPSYVSDWTALRSEDADHSKIVLSHPYRDFPLKVEVLVRPTDGPNAGWYFKADTAVQSNDNADNVHRYGGVVYLYNTRNIYLSAPMANSGDSTHLGSLIYTGGEDGRRLGNNHQTSSESYVRVKAYSPSDMPAPDYNSGWIISTLQSRSQVYFERDHNIGDYPAFVSVQMRCTERFVSDYMSEGIGSNGADNVDNTGGMLWAFNDQKIRVWTGYRPWGDSSTDNTMMGSHDGWNFDVPPACTNGIFRMFAWAKTTLVQTSNLYEKIEHRVELPEIDIGRHFDPLNDLLMIYVQANDGENMGYRFPTFGNAQFQTAPFGGVVFAYHPTGKFRAWRPNPAANGYLICVTSPYGNGEHLQLSNNAAYVFTVITGQT